MNKQTVSSLRMDQRGAVWRSLERLGSGNVGVIESAVGEPLMIAITARYEVSSII